jgi:hypothetical protein
MIIIFFIGFASIFIALATFDGLIHRLHRNHHNEWLACGRPSGIFRTPQEVSDLPAGQQFASSIANSRLSWKWMFFTPEWMNQELDALCLLRRMRIATMISIAGLGIWFIGGLTQLI